jgi:L-histidine N-alpha-methyltransferase
MMPASAAPGACIEPAVGRDRARMAADVSSHLTRRPRQLPCRYLYDDLGSALFDAISHLPWYTITGAESALLAAHGAGILDRAGPVSAIVELGPGNGAKLRTLLAGAHGVRPAAVHLVDISPGALASAAQALSPLPGIRVRTHEARFEDGLRDATREPCRGRVCVLFLGSNIGNFDPTASQELLRAIRRPLRPGDTLLLGADLVKRASDVLVAYDDPLGVTAAFNRNVLRRINDELGGDFALDQFVHRARWDAAASRVEMHLVARSRQRIRIAAADLTFEMAEGETIWTESSYKYRPAEIVDRLGQAGFQPIDTWVHREAGFTLTLAAAA